MLHQRFEFTAPEAATPALPVAEVTSTCPVFQRAEAAALSDWELAPLWSQLFDDANP
jgi:hypothetical protein